jgi:hypothetical protein
MRKVLYKILLTSLFSQLLFSGVIILSLVVTNTTAALVRSSNPELSMKITFSVRLCEWLIRHVMKGGDTVMS